MSTDPPSMLRDAGKALWSQYAGAYRLRPDELVHLSNACKAADMLAALEDAWSADGCPMVSTGSMGQEVIHPIIGEMRAQRDALDRAVARVKLPDAPAAGAGSSSGSAAGRARKAAAARWANGG